MSSEVMVARALLNRAGEPADIPMWKLVRDVGPVEAARRLQSGEFHLAPSAYARIESTDPWDDLEAADRHGLRLIVPESDEWPHFAFAALEQVARRRASEWERGKKDHSPSGELVPPLALWARGPMNPATLGVRSVAIVGARGATPYGEHVADDLGYALTLRGFPVVSGGALGIDAAAHRGALAGGGGTVLVSAGGLDRAYPAAHAALFEQVARDGLLLSESPPGAAPQRRRFLTRNRLIAALSTGTVVVEASSRSGAMNTAKHARDLGRPVMAVPGPVTSAQSVGCHILLMRDQDPASLVTSAKDVVAVVGSASDVSGAAEGAAASAAAAAPASAAELRRQVVDALDDTARRVFDSVPARRVIDMNELAVVAGLPVWEVIRAIPALETAQLLHSQGDGVRLVTLPRAKAAQSVDSSRRAQ